MAKFAPGCVAHPAAAWVPWLERKYLTAVQRDMQGNSLWTTGMTTARQIPSSACSFAQYELYVLTGILCYSREKSRDPHSLSAIWRRKLIRPPLCQVLPFSLTFLSQFDYFTWGCFSWWFHLFFFSVTVSEAQLWGCKTFLSTTNTSVSHIWDATILHLKDFLIICLHTSQFNKTS